MDEKIYELGTVIASSKKFPTNLRLFLKTEKNYIRIIKKKITTSYSMEDFVDVKYLKCKRGDILDVFSKMEFIINEIVQLKLLGPKLSGLNFEKTLMLDDLLEYVDFFSRLRLINTWGIIDKKLLNLIMHTKQVRNGFAHAWDESEVFYKGEKIKKNFIEFKLDIENIWKQILEIYKKEQEKIDVNELIEFFKNNNEKLEDFKDD